MTEGAGTHAWVVALDGRGAPVAEVGGKAAALDRLVSLGVDVPAAMAVTVHAYRRVVADPRLAALLSSLTRGGPAPGENTHVTADDSIDEAFLGAPLDDEVRTAIVQAARTLRTRVPGCPLVVRSSATIEDAGSASFAGQFRSFLGVADDDEVVRAVRLVWASLWHAAALAYRRAHGLDAIGADTPEMAVVLMVQVDARRSGVVFTADPAGRAGTVRVEVVDGLADALVGGRATPDVHFIDAIDLGGGAPDAPDAPADVVAAARAAQRIEAAFGAPQDVEWAFDGDRVFVVQARPITVVPVDPFDTPAGTTTTYTTAGIGEALPGVLPPLTWSIAGPAQDEAFRELFAAAGADLSGLDGGSGLLGRQRGHAVIDFDLLRAMAESIHGVDVAELESQYADVPATGATGAPNRRRWSDVHRLARVRRTAVTDAAIVAEAIDRIIDADVDLGVLGDDELIAYHRRLVDLGRRAIADETIVAATAAGAHRRLETLLGSWFDADEAAAWTRRVDVAPGRASALNGVPTDAPDLARRAGSRSVFGGPAWDEVTSEELAAFVGTVPPPRRDAGAELAALETTLQARRAWRTTRVLTGQVVDVRVHLLRRTVADARLWSARRNRAKDAVLRLGGEVRRVHRELGRRHAARGALAAPRDVELLSASELTQVPGRVELGRRRRQLDGHATVTLPLQFTGRAPSVDDGGAPGDQLTGWAASPGRARGTARVVRDPLHDRFGEGEVLVADATDASWLPLFTRAAAVIVERGGPLSHAAICARELGVPAVVNVPGAVRRLAREPAEVVVDGDAGTVTVLRSNLEPSEPAARHDHAARLGDRARRSAGRPIVDTLDELDAPALHVFVPAIMSLGVLASLGSLIVDAVRAVTRAGGWHRREHLLARLTATATVAGEAAARRDGVGLRRRGTYAGLSAGCSVLALYVAIGQTGNYLRSGGYLSDIAWLWAVALVLTAGFVAVAAAAGWIALRYHDPPPRVRAALMWTPLMRGGSGSRS